MRWQNNSWTHLQPRDLSWANNIVGVGDADTKYHCALMKQLKNTSQSCMHTFGRKYSPHSSAETLNSFGDTARPTLTWAAALNRKIEIPNTVDHRNDMILLLFSIFARIRLTLKIIFTTRQITDCSERQSVVFFWFFGVIHKNPLLMKPLFFVGYWVVLQINHWH